MPDDRFEKARALVEAVRGALARGCRHFDASGRELLTPHAVLDCLIKEGGVSIQEPMPVATRLFIATDRELCIEWATTRMGHEVRGQVAFMHDAATDRWSFDAGGVSRDFALLVFDHFAGEVVEGRVDGFQLVPMVAMPKEELRGYVVRALTSLAGLGG